MLVVACDLESVASPTTPVATDPPPTTTIIEPTTVPSEATAIDVGPLTARIGQSVIWTGEELIV